jgi:hypothetical protein
MHRLHGQRRPSRGTLGSSKKLPPRSLPPRATTRSSARGGEGRETHAQPPSRRRPRHVRVQSKARRGPGPCGASWLTGLVRSTEEHDALRRYTGRRGVREHGRRRRPRRGHRSQRGREGRRMHGSRKGSPRESRAAVDWQQSDGATVSRAEKGLEVGSVSQPMTARGQWPAETWGTAAREGDALEGGAPEGTPRTTRERRRRPQPGEPHGRLQDATSLRTLWWRKPSRW